MTQSAVDPVTPHAEAGQAVGARPLFWASIVAAAAAAGAIYHLLFGTGRLETAVVYGVCTGTLIVAFERGAVFPALQDRIRRLPTLIYIPIAEACYIALVGVANVVAGTLTWATGLNPETLQGAVTPTPRTLIFSLAASAVIVFVIRVRDLIGTAVFASLLLGRYQRPVREDRVFLFIDVVGSTSFAETHGDLKAQEYLGAIFAALAGPVRRHCGSIDDYVGDLAIVSWPHARAAREARCVACVFDFLRVIEKDAVMWNRRFGQVPRVRAALHGGSVVTAEIGVDRHKIAYFGDVVNTTARLEALCRTLEAPILISSDLLACLPGLPAAVRARPLGDHAVKGKGNRLNVLALERRV